MLRYLFKSDFFKSEEARFQRIKSPAELIASVLRLTEEFAKPDITMNPMSQQVQYMGQHLLSPPSVEGWHWGTEWIDCGALVERVNFASEHFGNLENPGVRALVNRILEAGDDIAPEAVVDSTLAELAITEISDNSRDALIDFATKQSEIAPADQTPRERVVNILKLAGATPEFQRA